MLFKHKINIYLILDALKGFRSMSIPKSQAEKVSSINMQCNYFKT